VGDLVHGLPDCDWFTGRRRRGVGADAGWQLRPCGHLPLAVLTATGT
jgi:hypothetical protein